MRAHRRMLDRPRPAAHGLKDDVQRRRVAPEVGSLAERGESVRARYGSTMTTVPSETRS